MRDLANAAVVLVEPWEPGNVGASARAMNNLGLSDLRLVVADPVQRLRLRRGDALRFAPHAQRLVSAARFFEDLPAALVDCGAAFAFTARTGKGRSPRASWPAALERMVSRLDSTRVALVFGPEERGLRTRDLEQATEIVGCPCPESTTCST